MRTLQTTLVSLIFIALSVVAFASIPSTAGDEMAMMDTDKDGRISPTEHLAGTRAMYSMMDANRDGKVTPQEMDDAQPPAMDVRTLMHRMSSREKIATMDANRDGVLSEREYEEGAQKMFAKMDTNKDGYLTLSELQAGREKMMKK